MEFFVNVGTEKFRVVTVDEIDLEAFQKTLQDYGPSSIEGVIFLIESYGYHVYRGRDRRDLPAVNLF